MSWHFDETSGQYVTLTDHAALTLPDDDWTIAGWLKLDDNVGSNGQYFLSWGGIAATPSLNLVITEASFTDANELATYINNENAYSSTQPGTSTDWMHIIVQRWSTTVRQFVNGVSVGTCGNSVSVDVAGNLYFGARSDNDANRRLGGYMAEWAKWDRLLTDGEKALLVSGATPDSFSTGLVWYCPMYDDFSESIVPLEVTNSNATVDSNVHPDVTSVISIDGTIAGTSALEGTLTIADSISIAGEAAGTSALSGTISILYTEIGISGAIAGTSTMSGTIYLVSELAFAHYVDCDIKYRTVTPWDDSRSQERGLWYPSDYSHLEGEEVQIVADGVVGTSEDVTSGAVDGDTGVDNHVGLAYTSTLIPSKIDIESMGIAINKKIITAIISFYNTSRGEYGVAEFYTLSPTYATGIQEVPVNAGYEREGNITIKQASPCPMTIRGVILPVGAYNK